MSPKSHLRREIEPLRKALGPDEIDAMSSKIIANVKKLDAFRSAKMVGLYRAIAGEVRKA